MRMLIFPQSIHCRIPRVAHLIRIQAAMAALLRPLMTALPFAGIVRGNAPPLTLVLKVAILFPVNAMRATFHRPGRIHAVAHALLGRMNALAAAVVIHRAVLRHAFVAAFLRMNPVARTVALCARLDAVGSTLHEIGVVGNARVATLVWLGKAARAVALLLTMYTLVATFAKILIVLADTHVAAFSRLMLVAFAFARLACRHAFVVAFEKSVVMFGNAVLPTLDGTGWVTPYRVCTKNFRKNCNRNGKQIFVKIS